MPKGWPHQGQWVIWVIWGHLSYSSLPAQGLVAPQFWRMKSSIWAAMQAPEGAENSPQASRTSLQLGYLHFSEISVPWGQGSIWPCLDIRLGWEGSLITPECELPEGAPPFRYLQWSRWAAESRPDTPEDKLPWGGTDPWSPVSLFYNISQRALKGIITEYSCDILAS